MKGKLAAVVLICVSLTLAVGVQTTVSAPKPKPMVIGWTPPDWTPVFITITKAAEREVEEANKAGFDIKLITKCTTSHTEFAQQVSIIEDYIQRKVDVIVISAIDMQVIKPAVNRAKKAGIPVIIVNWLEDVPGMDVDAYVGYRNDDAGRLAAEWSAKRLKGTGKIALIEGIPGGYHSEWRKRGYLEVLKKYPGLELVACQPADWERSKAVKAAENILQANPKIDLMMCLCDEMLMGAIQAVKAAGRSNEIIMQGFDGTEEALKALSEGKSEADLTLKLEEWGRKFVQLTAMLSLGKPIPHFVDVYPEVVDKTNLSQYYPKPKWEPFDYSSLFR